MPKQVRKDDYDDTSSHDLLIRLDEKVMEILRRLDIYDGRQTKIEARVDALENFRWWILGAAAAIGFLFSFLGSKIFGR